MNQTAKMKQRTPQEGILLNQMEMVIAIVKEVDRQGNERERNIYLCSRWMNAVTKAATDIVMAHEQGEIFAYDGMPLAAWRLSDDTGLSSTFIDHVLCRGGSVQCKPAFPYDTDDFGRCWRLLHWVIPPRRDDFFRLMPTAGPEWTRLVQHWVELEGLFENDEHEKLTARIRELTTTTK